MISKTAARCEHFVGSKVDQNQMSVPLLVVDLFCGVGIVWFGADGCSLRKAVGMWLLEMETMDWMVPPMLQKR